MKLNEYNPPHIRFSETNKTMMDDVIIALMPLCFMAFYYYGVRALAVCAVSVLACLGADMLGALLLGKKPNLRDHSSIVTGLVIALLMPASIEYYIPVAAAVFAIFVVKFPFGGVGNNMFNPAAAGFAFAAICWPARIFMYTTPLEKLPVFGEISSKMAQGPANTLSLGGIPTYDGIDMLLGNINGPMGATHILVILTCLIFLLFRKTVPWHMPVLFMLSAALYAAVFPRAGLSAGRSVMFELMSGSLLFGAVFVLTDPVTTPKRWIPRAIYAAVAGLAAMLFRTHGEFEQGVAFTILIMNVFSPLMDSLGEMWYKDKRRRLRNENKKATTA